MNQKTSKISAGLRALAHKPNEIISGTVVPGSLDMAGNTITVQPSDDGEPIEGVRLNAIMGDANGLVLYPADNSNVVIGSIDGPGEWILLRASDLVKLTATISNVSMEIDDSNITFTNSGLIFNISDTLFKVSTGGDSLHNLLQDLIKDITLLTVSTGTGVSSTPVNTASFNTLITRLGNLLTS